MEESQARLARRVATLDRLLALQVLLGVITLAVSCSAALRFQGTFAVSLTTAFLALATLALLTKADARIKLLLAVGSNLGLGVLTVYTTGINGAVVAYFQVGLVYGLLWLSRSQRLTAILVALLPVVVIVAASLSGNLRVQVLDASDPETWRFVIPICLSSFILVLVALNRTLRDMEEESRLLEVRHGDLIARISERVRAQKDYEEANNDLSREVGRQTGKLEELRQEFQFLSDSLIAGLRPSVEDLQTKTTRFIESYSARLSDDAFALLQRLWQRASAASTLLKDLRALGSADADALRWRETDVSRLAEEVLQEVRDRSGEAPVCAIDAGIRVYADPGLVRSVLRNLVENAWKFSKRVDEPRIWIQRLDRDGMRGFAVIDNGPGFDPHVQDRLFESFVRGTSTSTVPGSGIGLYTVRRIATRHQGKVLVETPVEGGARVGILFGSPRAATKEYPIARPIPDVSAYRIPSVQDWRADSVQVLLVAQLSCIVPLAGLYTPFIVAKDLPFTATIWLSCLILALATWKRGWSQGARAIVGLIPAVVLSMITWSRTTYYTAPVGITILALSLCMLFFGRRAMAAVAALVSLSVVTGYFNTTRHQIPVLSFDNAAQYWILQLLLGGAPLVVLLLTLGRAVARLGQARTGLWRVTSRLASEVEQRDRILQEAQLMREKLDSEVALRSHELLHTIEALSSFSYIVSHDLRGPVRSISGLIEILREDHGQELSAGATSDLLEIKDLNATLAALVERLIALAQCLKADPEPVPVNLSEEVKAVLPASMQSKIQPGLMVNVDLKMLRQSLAILSEYVVDRSHFSVRESGPSVVSFSGIASGFLEAVAESDKSLDDGQEIPIDAVALLRICRRMGGRLWVQNNVHGTSELCLALK